MAPIVEIGNMEGRAMVYLQPGDYTKAAYGYSPKSEGNKYVLQGPGVHRKWPSWETLPKLRFSNLAEFT